MVNKNDNIQKVQSTWTEDGQSGREKFRILLQNNKQSDPITDKMSLK